MSDEKKVYDADGNLLTPADYDRWGRTCIKLDPPPEPKEKPEEE